jgi:hypothetical protein
MWALGLPLGDKMPSAFGDFVFRISHIHELMKDALNHGDFRSIATDQVG